MHCWQIYKLFCLFYETVLPINAKECHSSFLHVVSKTRLTHAKICLVTAALCFWACWWQCDTWIQEDNITWNKVHLAMETNIVICSIKDEELEQTNLFSSCSSSSLCRLESCSLSLALQWAQTRYDLNKTGAFGESRREEWSSIFPSHSLVLFSNTSLYCRLQLVHVKVKRIHAHFYTTLISSTCRGVWLLLRGRCLHTSISFTPSDIVSALIQAAPLTCLYGHDCLSVSDAMRNGL